MLLSFKKIDLEKISLKKSHIKKFSAVMMTALMTSISITVPVFAEGDPVEIIRPTEDVERTVGDVSVTDEEDAVAVVNTNGVNVDLTTGNVEQSGVIDHNQGYGIAAVAEAPDGGKSVNSVTVNGDVSASVVAVLTEAAAGGENVIEVMGNTNETSSGGSEPTVPKSGVAMKSSEGGENDVTIHGYIGSVERPFSMFSTGEDSVNLAQIDGNVNGYGAANMYAEKGGINVVFAGQDVISDQIVLFRNNEGYNHLIVKGDISTKDGLYLNSGAAGEGINEVVSLGSITGGVCFNKQGEGEPDLVFASDTLHGSEGAIALAGDTQLERDSVIAWKVESDTDDLVCRLRVNENADDYTLEPDREAEKNIGYVIRTEAPEAGATLMALKGDGSPLDAGEILMYDGDPIQVDYAYEGDKVILRINMEDGYELDGVFSDEGKTESLLVDENGNYYVIVPRGGGVMLSVRTKFATPYEKSSDPADTAASGSQSVTALASDDMNIALITESALGSAVSITLPEGTGLSAGVVASLLARRDVATAVSFVLNGVTYKVVIPAGADLLSLINAAGGIDIEALIKAFGVSAA